MTARVQICNLFKTYYRRKWWFSKAEEFPVLKDVSLEISENKVLGLVGESGCGKSTLCKVLLGIENATDGKVIVNGKNTQQLSRLEWKNLRRELQVVFQDPYSSLDPRMNVRQLLCEPLDIHGLYPDSTEREKVLKDTLSSVGLSADYLTRYPHEFSGGQRQRICLARALVLSPSILVADEPVSALDVSVQAQILNLLKEIKRERKLSMLFVTHDFAVARFLCDEIAVMYKGRLVERALADELFTHPLHPYTQALLAAVPEVGGKLSAAVESETENSDDFACPFAPRCPRVKEACKKAGNELTQVTPGHFCACVLAKEKNK